MPVKPPFFPQGKSHTCACACLRMVLAYNGRVISEEQAIAASGTRPPGSYSKQIVAAAHYNEFKNSWDGPLTFKSLQEKVSAGLLPITYLYKRPQTTRVAHAVIIYEITGGGDEDVVRFIDPALPEPGDGALSVADFRRYWDSAGNITIIIKK